MWLTRSQLVTKFSLKLQKELTLFWTDALYSQWALILKHDKPVLACQIFSESNISIKNRFQAMLYACPLANLTNFPTRPQTNNISCANLNGIA